MKAKGIKRVLTVALATTMVLGTTMTAFAETTPGTSEGAGTYEGGEMQYPTLSVTLPTIPEHTYDYIADPNGLIAMTDAAHYADSTFTGNTGVFFLTTPKTEEAGSKNAYTNKSAAQTLTNQNAQDIDVTVKLEQKTAGSDSIAYSDAATFETTDTANKLYLAVTDDAAQDPAVSALTASSAATLSATVAGKPSNYKPNYDSTNGYGYVLKTKAENDNNDLTWNSCSFTLTGALNKNADWASNSFTFPTIKVTWSYAEHQDNAAPSIATTTYNLVADTAVSINVNLGAGDLAATAVTGLKNGSQDLPSDAWTYSNGVLTITAARVNSIVNAGVTRTYTVVFNDTAGTTVDITLNGTGN